MLCTVILSTSGVAMAQSLQDRIGLDKVAHLGTGYIIENQFKKHTKFTPFERALAVVSLVTIKETIDNEFDAEDILLLCWVLLFVKFRENFK